MKTGTILLVSGSITGHETRARLIQKFQSVQHKESGKWNHSALCWETRHNYFIVEAQSKGVLPAQKTEYSWNTKINRLYLVPKFDVNACAFENLLIQYMGTPYSTIELIRESVILTLTDKWIGRKGAKAAKRMRCHEFVMFIYNEYSKAVMGYEMFPRWFEGSVMPLFLCDKFEHREG